MYKLKIKTNYIKNNLKKNKIKIISFNKKAIIKNNTKLKILIKELLKVEMNKK